LPTYEYACRDCKARFEVFQRITEDALTTCEKCGGPIRRVVHPVGIVYKGSGFYTTDYARKSSAGGAADGNGKEESGKGESSEPKTGEKKSEPAKTKSPETTPSTKD